MEDDETSGILSGPSWSWICWVISVEYSFKAAFISEWVRDLEERDDLDDLSLLGEIAFLVFPFKSR